MKDNFLYEETSTGNDFSTSELFFSKKVRLAKKDKEMHGFYTAWLKNFDGKIRALEKRIAADTSRNIEMLSIFVALITFVSLEAQIFKNSISVLSVAGFSCLLLGGLAFFVQLIRQALSAYFDQQGKSSFGLSWIVLISLFVLGIFLINQGHKEILLQEGYMSQIQGKIEASLTIEEFNAFKECLKAGGWAKCF